MVAALRNDQVYEPAEYQDALDTDPNESDPITHELTDDPTEGFGVPPEEFKSEMDKLDTDHVADTTYEDDEDMREEIEGQQEKRGL